ncbi:MAG: UDP-N-acetylglucosamine 1-carboxyvinyltransferase [Candidatus Dormibacteria bacterium]
MTSSARRLEIDGGIPLEGEMRVSGSKNAALPIMAACLLTDEPCRLANVPALADVETAQRILEGLGVSVAREGGSFELTAAGRVGSEVPADAGRLMRASILFIGPLLARTGRAVVPRPGGDDIGARRVDQHIYGLLQLGARIEERDGTLDCFAEGLKGAEIQLDMPTVSGTENLMMAATLAEGRTTISNAAREPHVQDLARALNSMGARVEGAGTDEIEVEGVDRLGGYDHRVTPDYLEAGTYMLAVAATGGELTLEEAPVRDLHALVLKLRHAGVEVSALGDRLTLRRYEALNPVDLITWTHPGFATDLQPQYTALMTQAEGQSIVQEFLFENRFHYVSQLRALGAHIEVASHGRSIGVSGPARLVGGALVIPDIRAGAALLIAALCAEGRSTLSGVEHLDRGYEALAGKLAGLGARLSEIRY